MDSLELSSGVIRSKDNPAVKLFRKLIASKKERQSSRLFPLEGSRLVLDALKENAPIRRIFVTESALNGSAGEKISEFIKVDRLNVTVVSDELGNKMSDTDKTQGIFAVCELPKDSEPTFKKRGKYIVLYQLQDPGNAGMIIRTADALGMDGVVFCESCDVYSPKTVRATMGSLFRVPVFTSLGLDRIFDLADGASLETYAAVVDSEAENLKNVSFENGGILFIGNEGNGLPTYASEKCGKCITIKMNGNIDSLNAAMAAGIMMWEMKKYE